MPGRRDWSVFVIVGVIVTSLIVPQAVVSAAPCWRAPVAAPIADPFREPACRWCAGNRGIEYATAAGDPVRAVASGVVTYSGSIAGTTYLVVRHADGLRVTYGNLSGGLPGIGDVVVAGIVVGRAAGHLHFGVRDGDRYIDPAPMIGELRGVVRLVPTDGSATPPSPPPTLVCGGDSGR